ncbi:MAG: hypothetical protein V7776_23695, partial [Halopseudomonas aestusnigri]
VVATFPGTVRILTQAYNEDGTFLGDRSNTGISRGAPEVSGLSDGGWVVVWQTNRNEIRGQIYNADGSEETGEFRISSNPVGRVLTPSVSDLSGGGFVVTWENDVRDGDQFGIYGQAYKADGTTQGDEFLVNTETGGVQRNVSVTSLTDGGWVVIWESYGVDGNDVGVYGQAYKADGTTQGDEFLVFNSLFFRSSTSTDAYEFIGSPFVTSLTDGGWVVTSVDGNNGFFIYTKTFNSDGSVRSYYDPGTGLQYYAYNEGSDALVVFTDLSISDADNFNLSSASVSVSDFVTGDILGLADGFSLPSGIDVSYDPATGILSLTGSAGLA